MRIVLAALTVVAMGCAIAGIGMGHAPAELQAPPAASELVAAKQRIAVGGATTARGRALFEEEGCDACHSIAAVGAEGTLGPRLDMVDDDVDEIVESITEPREEIADGFAEKLMPTDYAQRMSDAEIQALATFVAAASGTREEDGAGDEDSGRGGGEDSGRGRGRGGG